MQFLPILGCFLTFVVASYGQTTENGHWEVKTTKVWVQDGSGPTNPGPTTSSPTGQTGSTAYDFLLDYNAVIAATDAFQIRVSEFVKKLDTDKNVFSILIQDENSRFKTFRTMLEKESQAASDKGELYDIYLPDMIKHIYRCATLMKDSEAHGKNSMKNLNLKIKDVATRAEADVGKAIAEGKKIPDSLQQHLKDLKRIQATLTEAIVNEEFENESKYLKEIYELELTIKEEIAGIEGADF